MKRERQLREFEPTDEELHQLSHEAFADVAQNHARALARLREEIEALREQRRAEAEPRASAR